MAVLEDDSQQWYPEPSKQQVEAAQEQERKIVSSLPVLQDVLDWFDAQIAVYADPTTITGIGINTDAEDVKQAVLFAQNMIKDYRRKRDEFESAFSGYIQEDADAAA